MRDLLRRLEEGRLEELDIPLQTHNRMERSAKRVVKQGKYSVEVGCWAWPGYDIDWKIWLKSRKDFAKDGMPGAAVPGISFYIGKLEGPHVRNGQGIEDVRKLLAKAADALEGVAEEAYAAMMATRDTSDSTSPRMP